ncbi:MAG: hypothetical protein ISS49_11460, partial [Anaerolineae bacterium]|nr:hypothetical protein [Anaerolineae bacterium]
QAEAGEAAEEEAPTTEVVASEATEEETAISEAQAETGEAAEEKAPTTEADAMEAYAEESTPDAAEKTASRIEVPVALDEEEKAPNETFAPDVASKAEAVN